MRNSDELFFSYENGILKAEGVQVPEIAKQVGTPFYLYSASSIARSYAKLAFALSGLKYSISYAVKANSNIAILKHLGSLGAGMDIVSSGEYLRAKSAGIAGDRIVFSGVGKTMDEMAIAIEGGIKQFNVESESELTALNSVAKNLGKRIPIVIRVNPDIDALTHEKISTGRSDNKFGIPYSEAIEFFEKASKFSNLEVSGLAVHIGSQLTDLEPFKRTFVKIAEMVAVLKNKDYNIKRIDLGGGIGISYSDRTKVIDLQEYANTIKTTLGHLDCEFEFEPGRFLVGNSGLFICSVIYFKSLENRKFLVIDGAMNDLMRPAMYNAYHEAIPINNLKNSPMVKMDIVGPVCETSDTFCRDRNFPLAAEGDLIAFCSAGAYGAVMASEYNSRPLIPEVLVKGLKFSIIRERPTIQSIIDRDIIPDWLD